MRTAPSFRPRAARGFTIAELLVAMAVGLVILAGLSTMFVKNMRTQGEIEKANRQVENGRFALDLLAVDLRNAGYFAEFDPSVLDDPAALPAPCASTVAQLKAGLKLPVQGLDNSADGLACLSDVRTGTDVLVVRRTSTCVAGAAGCAALTDGGPYFQASLCNNASELDSSDHADWYALDTITTGMTRHRRDCAPGPGTGTLAAIRRYVTHIYFIANNNKPGDGIPTLKRAELTSDGGEISWPIVPLADGIENLQLEYGMDLLPAGGGDGVADQFSAAPGSVANWMSVVSIKLNLLARNASASDGYGGSRTYTLGLNADGSANTVTPATGDHYKRHLFQSLVALPNPAGRRTP
jgi:type IV pilus assembly protein PilW